MLCQVGRTHFEAVEYRSAAAAFEAARALDGQRVEGMELYSTVLWHLRRESELAHLVQEVQSVDRLSPQVWGGGGAGCGLAVAIGTRRRRRRCCPVDQITRHGLVLERAGTEFASQPLSTTVHSGQLMHSGLSQAPPPSPSFHTIRPGACWAILPSPPRPHPPPSPPHCQAWCVLGNFCSLQKDHESAVELFQRAVQLDPTFTYAFTLAGHEYFANEDYDKSMACYRNAVRLDPRHYNAMYGLGQVSGPHSLAFGRSGNDRRAVPPGIRNPAGVRRDKGIGSFWPQTRARGLAGYPECCAPLGGHPVLPMFGIFGCSLLPAACCLTAGAPAIFSAILPFWIPPAIAHRPLPCLLPTYPLYPDVVR